MTKKYMYNSEVISDWEIGSVIVWRDAGNKKIHVKDFIKDIKPERSLSTIDLSIDSGLPDIESYYSHVTYELLKENDKTQLLIIENNFNGDAKRYKDSDKFWENVLKELKELFEK